MPDVPTDRVSCRFYGKPPSVLAEVFDGVAEQLHAMAFSGHAAGSPLRMLGRQHMPLGVRHHPEHTPAGIAKPGNIAFRSVRVLRVAYFRGGTLICRSVPEHALAALFDAFHDPGLAEDELAFSVGH